MTRHEVRIEILKLCHRHDYGPEQILDRAKKLESWVMEGEKNPVQEDKASTHRAPSKKKSSGNADDILS